MVFTVRIEGRRKMGGGAQKWGLYRFLSVGLAFGRVGRLCRRPGAGFDVGTRALPYIGL